MKSNFRDDWAARFIQWAAECFRQANQSPTSGQFLKLTVEQIKPPGKKLVLIGQVHLAAQ